MDGILPRRRAPVSWESRLPFRILALDGGGIKGIFPAAVLANLEEEHLDGNGIGQYFDLIAGTSTGGILALGMGAGMTAGEILRMYLEQGHLVFPTNERGSAGPVPASSSGAARGRAYAPDSTVAEFIINSAILQAITTGTALTAAPNWGPGARKMADLRKECAIIVCDATADRGHFPSAVTEAIRTTMNVLTVLSVRRR